MIFIIKHKHNLINKFKIRIFTYNNNRKMIHFSVCVKVTGKTSKVAEVVEEIKTYFGVDFGLKFRSTSP